VFQKELYNFEGLYLFRGHIQCFEQSQCIKIHRALDGVVMVHCDYQFPRDARRVEFHGLLKLSLSCSTVASETHGRPDDLAWPTEYPASTKFLCHE
jgi:hypothetical protein